MGINSANSQRQRVPRALGFEQRALTTTAVLIALVGSYLLFHELPMTGLTWDECMDFEIARDYLKNQSFLTNLQDPSQGRLSHLIGAGSFALFGESYLAFKLPFALLGLFTGLCLWHFLHRLVRPGVAALVAALYFTCPYVLAAFRAAATAGDGLVLATTAGFVITLYHWTRTSRFWPYGASCGVICGLSIGAKWTSGLLLVAAALTWMVCLWRKRRLFDSQSWTALLAHQWIAIGVAFVASPTLLLGWPFVESSLHHSMSFKGMEMMQLGEMRSTTSLLYFPAVLISKFSPAQLLLFAYELGLVVFGWMTRRKRAGTLRTIALLSLLPMVPLLTKGFQNAHYYVATVPAVMVFSALTLERWTHKARPLGARLVAWLGTVAALAQLALSVYLAPDYLLAGRQFGTVFYGQFAGPAVNHCQGMPYAIDEINHLIEQEQGPRAAYVLSSCVAVMNHAIANGPVRPLAAISAAPASSPALRHFLIVPRSYDYDILGAARMEPAASYKAEMTRNCERAGQGHADYDLWFCSGSETVRRSVP